MIAATASNAATVELVADGGFESGTSNFFSSDFTEVAGGTSSSSQFVVSTGANGVVPNNGSWFMLVNGNSTSSIDPVVWSQDVSVTTGTEYTFSFSMADWSGASPNANLDIQLGSVSLLNVTSSAATDVWEGFSTKWVSTLTGTFDLSFIELSTGFVGNDYTLDDISLTYDTGTAPVPLPASAWLLSFAVAGLLGLRRRNAM